MIEQLDREALKSLIREIIVEDNSSIKAIIKEILEEEKSKDAEINGLIDEVFDKYDDVFKALV